MIVERLRICDLCFPDSIEIGEFIENYTLAYNAATGQYFVVDSNGHDVAWVFKHKPIPEPDIDDESNDDWDKWIDLAKESMDHLKWNISQGYELYNSAVAMGYTEDDGYIEYWIFERAGLIIKEWEDGTLTYDDPSYEYDASLDYKENPGYPTNFDVNMGPYGPVPPCDQNEEGD